MKVIKRDGSTADFDSSKIIVAIQKANQVVEPEDVSIRNVSKLSLIMWKVKTACVFWLKIYRIW